MDMDYLFIKLTVAFLCGITLFVVIIVLKNRKSEAQKRRTTSVRLAKVAEVSDGVSEAAAVSSAVTTAKSVKSEMGESKKPEPDNAAPAAVAAEVAEVGEVDVDTDDNVNDNISDNINDDTDDNADADVDAGTDIDADEDADVYADADVSDVYAPMAGMIDEQVEDDADADAVTGGADSYNDTLSADEYADRGIGGDGEDGADDDREETAHDPEESFAAKPLILDGAIEADEKKIETAPPAVAAAVKPAVKPAKKRMPEIAAAGTKERKVLLVDDMEMNRELIAASFDGSGIKFEFAENGKEACGKFAAAPDDYSLILMDIRMPVLDGFDAARTIRAMDVDWAKQIPIIAMSGDSMDDDIDQCFDAGMDDHIAKPIDMDLLSEKVFEFIAMNAE